MKQHVIPENIMDVEFKLFGSLTAKQFGYIVGSGVIAVVVYYVFKAVAFSFLGIIFGFIIVLIGLSLALLKVNEQPFEIWLANFFIAMFSSQRRVWQRTTPKSRYDSKVDFSEISNNLVGTSYTNIKSMKQQENISDSQFFNVPGTAQQSIKISTNQNMRTQTFSPRQQQNVVGSFDQNFVPGQSGIFSIQSTNFQSSDEQNQNEKKENDKLNNQISNVQIQNQNQDQDSLKQDIELPQDPNASINKAKFFQEIIPDEVQNSQNQQLNSNFVNQVLDENKKLREKLIELENEKKRIETDLNSIKQMYENLKNENANQEIISTESQNNQNQQINIDSVNQVLDENKKLREKLIELENEKKMIGTDLNSIKQMYENLKNENAKIISEFAQIKSQLVTSTQKNNQANQTTNLFQSSNFAQNFKSALKVYNGPSLSRKPNVISGIVLDKNGNLLPGVVVIIKDSKVDPPRAVRAMKTNSLGQFVSTEIEENGLYYIELSKENYRFMRYEIELTGSILPTYEFISE